MASPRERVFRWKPSLRPASARFAGLAAVGFAACAHAPVRPEAAPSSSVYTEEGVASVYASTLTGRTTANGERYDPTALTAAHRTLPLGTRVRVVSQTNGRSVVVRINDRGPYVRGRIIDLSRAAAEEIGLVGLMRVELQVH